MTSSDTLGRGVSGNVSTILPSVTVNGTIPDDGNLIPRPWKSRVTAVKTGIGAPNASPAVTETLTPQQVANFLNKYIFGPGMGSEDELSPFDRSLRGGLGTVGTPDGDTQSIRYVGSRYQNPLGDGMGDWRSSASVNPQPSSAPSQQQPDRLSGLPGLILDQMQNS